MNEHSLARRNIKIVIGVFVFLIIATLTLSGCGNAVNVNELEEARATAKANATFNAQLYKAANPRFDAEYSIVTRDDTAQSKDCPMGDGWSNASLMKVEGKAVLKTSLYCSTYSTSVGCYRQEDFEKDRNLAGQDGRCRKTDVPYPLPVLKK